MKTLHTVHTLLIAMLFAAALWGCSGKVESKVPRPRLPLAPENTAKSTVHQPPPRIAADPYAQYPDNQPVIHRSQAGEPGADGWCNAESTCGNFSATLPGQFTDHMIKSTSTTGGIGVMHVVACVNPRRMEFNVLQTEIIGERPKATLNFAEGFAKDLEKMGARIKRHQVEIAGLPAVRLSARATGVSAEMVFLSHASSDYTISVQWHGTADVGFDGDIERFFSSFKLKEVAD